MMLRTLLVLIAVAGLSLGGCRKRRAQTDGAGYGSDERRC